MTNLLIKEKSYKSCYQETLKMANEIRSKIDIGVFVTVGPYPVDYLKLKKKFGIKEAIDIMKKGIDIAAHLCEENKCIGIGEIGRPHFPVDEQTFSDSNKIMIYGMKKAKDVGVPVIIHTESTTINQCKELAEFGRKVGLQSNKIVKHYSPPLLLESENYNIMPSVLASKKNIEIAVKKSTRFMMETDYIDDPKRPGAVLSPKTVPKRTRELIEKEILTEKEINIIHKNNPEKTYEICLDA
jgi:TatD-related deoxyribonuclease